MREWFRVQRFVERTGVPPQQAHFVRDRAGKPTKCRELGITHFIDDQLENLEILSGVVWHLFLLGNNPTKPGVVAVKSWNELGPLLHQSIAKEAGGSSGWRFT